MIPKIAILVPTRYRPKELKRFLDSYKEMNAGYSELFFCFQENDPMIEELKEITKDYEHIITGNIGCVAKVNALADKFKGYRAYLFGADDIVYKTKGFDKLFLEILDQFKQKKGHEIAILYGDDTIHGEKLATHPLLSAELIEAQGSFYPKDRMRHLFSDNWCMYLGLSCDILVYVPAIVMDHLHFIKTKAQKDKSYLESNAPAMYERDGEKYREYLKEDGEKMVENIKETIKLRSIKEAKE